MTGEIVKDAFDKYRLGLGGIAFIHVVFEFKLHDDKVKIKTVFTSSIDTNSVAWQRWRDLAKH